MNIIDAHNHIGGLATYGIGHAEEADDLRADIDARVQGPQARGVGKAIIVASHDYLRPDGSADNRRPASASTLARCVDDEPVGAPVPRADG